MKFVSSEGMREWEKGKDKLALMEHAGKAVAEELKERGLTEVVFVCGPGNNGGDCFTAARYLPNAKVFVAGEPKAEEAKVNHGWLKGDRFVDDFHGYECIVDCLLGIGAKGELREPIKSIVKEMNKEKGKGTKVVSVDVPTGLGTPDEVKADFTICLQFPKKGMEKKRFVVREIAEKNLSR